MTRAQEIKEQIKKLEAELERLPWEPEASDTYWFITNNGEIWSDEWDGVYTDRERRDFLGVFRTEKEATARRDAVRAFVEGLGKGV